MRQRRYPLGVQYFPEIREEGRVYVDKTEQVHRLTHLDSDYIFLNRPRRFGKSLLTGTLRCYFEGRRDLFKGLAIDSLEKEWQVYPVLHFEMNRVKQPTKDQLEHNIGLQLAQKVLRTVPYCDNANTEGHYQSLLYLLFTLMGQYVDVEVRTATGRIDMVMCTPDRLYIIELKLRDDAETALNQINLKQYPDRFALCNLPIVKIGISFDVSSHTIRDWRIMPE